jgi:FkbM family methyltransferase
MSGALLKLFSAVAAAGRRAGPGSVLYVLRRNLDRALLAAGVPILSAEFAEFSVRGFLQHRGFLEHISTGHYEPLLGRLLGDFAGSESVFVDGGAHIGVYSLLASRRIGAGGTVFAFEPDSYNFAALALNLRRNHCANVRPLNMAVSDRIGSVTFYQNPSTFSSSLIHRTGVGTCKPVVVETATIDSVLEGLPLPSLLVKLDVEGAEPLALQGMRKSAARAGRLALLVEINPSALRDGGFAPADVVAEIRTLGLTPQWIDETNGRLAHFSSEDPPRKGNLYCVREPIR